MSDMEMFDQEPDDDLTTEVTSHAAEYGYGQGGRGSTVYVSKKDVNDLFVEMKHGKIVLNFAYPGKPAARVSKRKPAVRLAKPPRLVWSWFARRLMSPAQYRKLCEPHIADMQAEYFDCLSKGDEAGARWAVIRGNLYAVPSWVWGAGGSFALWLKHLLTT